ncbi:MAG: retropepsin-like domain-containing protein, partial [Candidatus Thiodiazotropha taylori]|nr:retropepsin-like domain-containing protein [Candidatus Thiodiazotropha taylori]
MSINGAETTALVDSGSMITTISEEFYKTLSPRPKLYSIELEIQGAGGHAIPHLGCMECFIELPFLPDKEICVAAVVVPTTQYSLKVPVIVGTNAIERCREKCSENVQVPKEWNSAFMFLQQSRVGVVKSTNKAEIVIQPMETRTISGFVRKARNVEAAVTEHTEGASSRLGVCPRVVSLEKGGNYQRVPVRVFNMSAKVMKIKPNSSICELHDVKVIRTADPFFSETEKANVNQMAVGKDEQPTLPPGVNIDECAINDSQKERLVQFLSRWKGVFSAGITDLG